MKTRHWDRTGTGGLTFTELGFGTAPLGNLYRAVSEAEAEATLEAAWESGCRYFDTAPLYGLGLAETRMNRFLRGKEREGYVLSTKVGRLLEVCEPAQRSAIGKFFDTPARREVYDYSYDGVMRSVEASFERLGVDRIDVLFVHDLDVFNHGSEAELRRRVGQFMQSGYDALVELRRSGDISGFGGGVNEWGAAQMLAEAGDFDLFLLAGRYTLLEQEALESFLPLCAVRGIGVVLGGVYNSGILATGARAGATYNYDPAPGEILDRVGRIEAVCAAHGVAMIAAALRFPLAHPAVVSVVQGGQSPDQARQNAALLDAEIPAGLWSDLKGEGLMRADAPVPGGG